MTIKQLVTSIDQAATLKQISVAYTEIASNKLKKIRGLVEKNRNFLDELSLVYKIIKRAALERNILASKNKKTISILITSNNHFYGNVNQNLTSFFVSAMRSHPTPIDPDLIGVESGQTDQIVIGKTAQEYLKSVHYSLPYSFVALEHDYPESRELDSLIEQIKNYSQIVVFFSRMQSVMQQVPSFGDITQSSHLQEQLPPSEATKRLFIFEPEINKILDFFESQVMNLLLQQAFLESDLSRTASRLVSMDQAQTNANTLIHEQTMQLDQTRRSMANNRLLETYSSIILNGKEEQ